MEVMSGDMCKNVISNVFNCNCLEYMRTLPDNHFQIAVCDPPYGGAGNDGEIRNERGRFSKYKSEIYCSRTGGAWATKYGQSIKEWDVAPEKEFFDEIIRVSENQIIWGANYFTMPPTRCFLVWRKLSISETFTMAMAEYAWTSFNRNALVFEYAPQGKVDDPRFHPTQKPVELYAWILKNFAKEGDRIFDPMMGSGSSRIAAYKMGFDFEGCEISKEYFDKSVERFNRECLGIWKLKDGRTAIEQSLF